MYQLCLVLIQNKYDDLTTAEKKIADYILENPHEVLDLGASALAKQAGTAPSAVIRFCQTLGFSGYTKFKTNLAMELGNETKGYMASVQSNDSVATIFSQVFQSGEKALSNTMDMLDWQVVEQACEEIAKSTGAYFFGIGTSSTIASDAANRFMQLGLHTYYSNDILYMKMLASNMKAGEVAVGISHSGMTKATIDAMNRSQQAGAKTIAITSHKDSEISLYADYVINVYPDENSYPIEAVSSRVAHICVLDAMTVAVSKILGKKAEEVLERCKEAFQKIRQ